MRQSAKLHKKKLCQQALEQSAVQGQACNLGSSAFWPTFRQALLLYELVQLCAHILKRIPVALGPPACPVPGSKQVVVHDAGTDQCRVMLAVVVAYNLKLLLPMPQHVHPPALGLQLPPELLSHHTGAAMRADRFLQVAPASQHLPTMRPNRHGSKHSKRSTAGLKRIPVTQLLPSQPAVLASHTCSFRAAHCAKAARSRCQNNARVQPPAPQSPPPYLPARGAPACVAARPQRPPRPSLQAGGCWTLPALGRQGKITCMKHARKAMCWTYSDIPHHAD